MSFSSETSVFRICYGATGDVETQTDDQRQAYQVEYPLAQLLAMLAGAAYDGTVSTNGFAVSAGAGLAISVGAGSGFIGGLTIYAAGATAKSGLTDNKTLYIFLKATATTKYDRSFTVEFSEAAPPMADAICIAKVITAGGAVTSVDDDNSERSPRLPYLSTLRLGTAPPPVAQNDGATPFHSVTEGPNHSRITNYSDSAHGYLIFQRARGTRAAPTAVQTGDDLGGVWVWPYDGVLPGHDGSGFYPCGLINWIATQNHDATHRGTKICLSGTYTDDDDFAVFLTLLDGQVLAKDPAGKPAYSWEADPDTGLWRGGDNILQFITAGSARISIGATGGVTIGSLAGYIKGTAGLLSGQTGVPYGDLTYSGLTAGHALVASSPTAAAFRALLQADIGGLTTASDVQFANATDGTNTRPWADLAKGGVRYHSYADAATATDTETTLATWTCPAGLLGTAKGLRFTAMYSFSITAGQTGTVKTKFGGSTMETLSTGTGSGLVSYTWSLYNLGAANSQRWIRHNSNSNYWSLAVDTASAQALAVTGQCSLGTDNITLRAFLVEYLD